MQQHYKGNDYWHEVSSLYGTSIRDFRRMAPGSEISRLSEFVQSWDWLYTPRNAAFVNNAQDVSPEGNPTMRKDVIDIVGVAYMALAGVAAALLVNAAAPAAGNSAELPVEGVVIEFIVNR